MPIISVDMDKQSAFFTSELGQAVLTEMAKSDSLDALKAVVSCIHTSKETIAVIIERITVTEYDKYNNNDDAFGVIARAAENSKTDTDTLDIIYDFAMRLIGRYQVDSTPHRIAMNIFESLAIHPNTSENKLRKLVSGNNRFEQFVVKNPGISDKWLIELVESFTTQAEKLAAVPELVRRLKAKLQQ